MRLALRAVAVAIALAALVDPAVQRRRTLPLPIDIHTSATRAPEAADLEKTLVASLGDTVAVGTGETPAAVVLIGGVPADATLPQGAAVSTVTLPGSSRPNVRIVRVIPLGQVLPGQEAIVSAELEGVGVQGQTSLVMLEQDSVQLARIEHRWTNDGEKFVAELRYVPPVPGVQALRVVAGSVAGESSIADNVADVPLIVRAQPLRVVVHDPRPSWATGFVRRALESDPAFTLSSLVRPSRGLSVRAGAPPRALTADAIASFDAVVVGAPEELTASEVDGLETFARERGGAVILLPDRRPSGAYVRLLPAGGFDEALLEQPVALDGDRSGAGVKASELSLPRDIGAAGTAIAAIRHEGRVRPVIVSWPRGGGRIVFSGALDAWRHRALDDGAFARFWCATVASLAAAAPPRLSVRVEPALAAPHERLVVRATVRPTEFVHANGRTTIPAVDCAVIAADGSRQPLRLWPTAERGVFEAVTPAPPAGRYDVRASMPGSFAADAALIVGDGVIRPREDDSDALQMIAAVTGGVNAPASALEKIETHLRGIERPQTVVPVHPMRSAWWMVPFVGALCAEWTLRRRKGLI